VTEDPDATDRSPEAEPKPPPRSPGQGGRRRVWHQAGDPYPEWIAAYAASMEPILRQAEEVREQMARTISGLVSPALLADAFGQASRVSEMVRLPAAVVEMSALSHGLLGDSMITASLAARSANAALLHAFSTTTALDLSRTTQAMVASLTELGALVENQNLALARLHPGIEVARSVSLATRAWRDVVQTSRGERGSPYFGRAAVIGRGAGWAITSGIALTDSTDEITDAVHIETAAVLGAATTSATLREHLRALDPRLCDRLDGAWDSITRGGPDAASQAAHSLMELVDWTLRQVSPDDQVLAWHKAGGRPQSELHEGRPKRTLRVRFAVRDKPDKEPSLFLFVRATSGLVDALQGPKHGQQAHRKEALAPVALTVEALLLFLLGD
jgi:hypothetical protein